MQRLAEAYAAGDAGGTAAFFRDYVAVTYPVQYIYVPTEQDRAEINACADAAGPSTTAWDCARPTSNRVLGEWLQETKITRSG